VAESDRQWTGIAVSASERLFVCFPRWSDDVPVAVAERLPSGELRAYPDGVWNDWSPGGPAERRFVCVQALHVDANDDLWILDPGNPKFLGVVPGAPKLLRVDLETDEVVETLPFDAEAAPPASYLNDVRVDTERRVAYVTDSGLGAILVVDLATGFVRRRLEDHASTKSEGIDLLIEGRWWRLPDGSRPEVHADGIALTPDREWLYWQALTGRTLYRVPTRGAAGGERRGAAGEGGDRRRRGRVRRDPVRQGGPPAAEQPGGERRPPPPPGRPDRRPGPGPGDLLAGQLRDRSRRVGLLHDGADPPRGGSGPAVPDLPAAAGGVRPRCDAS
jgi:sugar lactone lactonase YvrE